MGQTAAKMEVRWKAKPPSLVLFKGNSAYDDPSTFLWRDFLDSLDATKPHRIQHRVLWLAQKDISFDRARPIFESDLPMGRVPCHCGVLVVFVEVEIGEGANGINWC